MRKTRPATFVAEGSGAFKTPWDNHDSMWVVGCIDHAGAITARAAVGLDSMHRRAESRGKRWRWCIWTQEFCAVRPGMGELTEEEIFIVMDWLVKNGYTDDERFVELAESWRRR